MYGKDILESNNPDDITNILLDNNFDFGGIAITETEMKKDEKGQDIEVKTTKSFANREFDLADKYLEIKNKPDSQLTDEEKKLKFSVERSLKGSEQDQKMMFEYQEAENKIIKANLVTPYNYMSALIDNNVTDKDGNPYDITWDTDEAKKNPNLILARLENGTVAYDLTTKQKEAAENAIRDQIRAKLDEEMKYVGSTKTQEQIREENAIKREELAIKKEQANKKPKTEKWERDAWEEEQQLQSEANFIYNLYNGTPQEIQRAKEYFENNKSLNIEYIDRTPNGINIKYLGDDNIVDIPFFVGDTDTPLGGEKFYEQAYGTFYGINDKGRLQRGKSYINKFEENPNLSNETLFNPPTDYTGAQYYGGFKGGYLTQKRLEQSVQPGPLKSKAGKSATGGIIKIPRN
jgi:hypothetical protein